MLKDAPNAVANLTVFGQRFDEIVNGAIFDSPCISLLPPQTVDNFSLNLEVSLNV